MSLASRPIPLSRLLLLLAFVLVVVVVLVAVAALGAPHAAHAIHSSAQLASAGSHIHPSVPCPGSSAGSC